MQKKKIAFVELYYHSEVLRTYLGLVAEVADYEVIVLSKKSVLTDIEPSLLKASNIQYFVKPETTPIPDFIMAHLTRLNTCSSVFFLTIDSAFRFFATVPICAKKFLIVHAAYSVLQPLQHLAWQLDWRFWARLFKKMILEQESVYVKKMIQNMDVLVFGSHTVQEFIVKKELLPTAKKLFSLPFTYHETKPETRNPKLETILTITGTVEQNRRDYEVVFQALRQCTFKTAVRVVLLGRAKGKEGDTVINQFKRLENEYFKLEYFTEMIPQAIFDKKCMETDFFILPFTETVHFSIYKELGSKTAVSGGVGDVIRYGVPAFVPSYYEIEANLKEMITSFENVNDLAQQLTTWVEDKNYVEKKENASILLENYSQKALQQRFCFLEAIKL